MCATVKATSGTNCDGGGCAGVWDVKDDKGHSPVFDLPVGLTRLEIAAGCAADEKKVQLAWRPGGRVEGSVLGRENIYINTPPSQYLQASSSHLCGRV